MEMWPSLANDIWALAVTALCLMKLPGYSLPWVIQSSCRNLGHVALLWPDSGAMSYPSLAMPVLLWVSIHFCFEAAPVFLFPKIILRDSDDCTLKITLVGSCLVFKHGCWETLLLCGAFKIPGLAVVSHISALVSWWQRELPYPPCAVFGLVFHFFALPSEYWKSRRLCWISNYVSLWELTRQGFPNESTLFYLTSDGGWVNSGLVYTTILGNSESNCLALES